MRRKGDRGPGARALLASLLVVAFCLPARNAQAYIDPGSVSFVFQAAIATLFGFLFVLKRYWLQIKGKMRSLFSSREDASRGSRPVEAGLADRESETGKR